MDITMAEIFSPWQMNQLPVPNRLVRSATWEGLASPEGAAGEEAIDLLANLARGGVGLIITGAAFVSPEGRALPRQTGVHSDAMVEPLSRMARAVHRAGGLVALQICHAGGQTKREWIGEKPLGPSAILHPRYGEAVGELTREQIADIVESYATAVARARAAGFDAVQLHGAHGYLINQFLSPHTNQRHDDYGGSLQNRSRFCHEVCQAARQAVGADYPVFIKLNVKDNIEGGLEAEEGLEVASELAALGIDAIEVSGGVAVGRKYGHVLPVKGQEDEGYFLDEAKAVRAAVSCPVVTVGGFRGRAKVERALEHVDAVALCRPFIRQPRLALSWQAGSQQPASCISCNQCLDLTRTKGLTCGQELGAINERDW
jgi:2,4-dienoyl-CoA reductase-like NADH-dependent reductase (Old Yellow Enzyme family)